MLRRIKHDTDLNIPPKKEILVKVRMNRKQFRLYKEVLLTHKVTTMKTSKLRNVLMQLRKVCLHPYLFDGVEPENSPVYGEHLVRASSKLRIMDLLLKKLHKGGHKVLIFSQFTSMLNILEDYCGLRKYSYVRLDGGTDPIERADNIERFQTQSKDTFIFLLSTRAGGLGINLTRSDTVILYDSDFNPQFDLQAMDRAHRIGQKNPVNVYRLVVENSIEERIIERQMVKLKWDYLIIEKGRKKVKKDIKDFENLGPEELQDLMLFGATETFNCYEDEEKVEMHKIDENGEAVFQFDEDNKEEEIDEDEEYFKNLDIDKILERGALEFEEKEKVIEDRIKEFEKNKL